MIGDHQYFHKLTFPLNLFINLINTGDSHVANSDAPRRRELLRNHWCAGVVASTVLIKRSMMF